MVTNIIAGYPTKCLPYLALLERPAEQAGMIKHCYTNHKRIAEMHTWHRGKRVHKVPAHPYTSGIIVPDGVEEAKFRR
ncbi:MAG: hypothetical protein LQ342_007644 [Letrouitia transgressa]|nr:MAG: hypothetical protein LQ342_007644 [Letrouitia transgressa]